MNDDTIGGRIVELRGPKSQSAWAAELGENKSTIGSYERNETSPSAGFLAKLAARGVNINWLLTGDGAYEVRENTVGYSIGGIEALNLDALIACIEGVEQGLAQAGVTLPPQKKAEVIAKWYELHCAERDGEKLASVKRAVADLTRSYH